jgi:hypothetical protein
MSQSKAGEVWGKRKKHVCVTCHEERGAVQK